MKQGLIVIVIFVFSALSTFAQPPPVETKTVYYEDENPNQLDTFLLFENVCLERFIHLNPDIDITYVPYGQKITLPVDEPCFLGNQISYRWSHYSIRLKYYENGDWLDEPYYSVDVVLSRDVSLEKLGQVFGVCKDDLLADNILLQDFETYKAYTDYTTMDVFAPQKSPSCEPPFNHVVTEWRTIDTTNIDFSLLYLSTVLNICHEEAQSRIHDKNQSHVRVHVPHNPPPCYNDLGQRLRFYDDFGIQLSEPVYSDLPIHITDYGETVGDIAEQYGVCAIDILRVNGFIRFPISSADIFIPPQRECPTDIEILETNTESVSDIRISYNVCPSIIEELNPYLKNQHVGTFNTYSPYDRTISVGNVETTFWIIPTQSEPCYITYKAREEESVYDIEKSLNVCHEEFNYIGYVRDYKVQRDDVSIYIPINSPPCYNEVGERLYYPPPEYSVRASYKKYTGRWQIKPLTIPYYTNMQVYELQRGDTAYIISQKFNVCVHDLLSINPELKSSMKVEIRIFIPKTPPCYDEFTGLPLIYEDNNGEALSVPQVGDQLIYYGSQPLGRISNFYNVCINRIEDANRAKIDKEAQYLGWIIPTHRPPCYDADGHPIDYVCYSQAIDMSIDYRNSSENIIFDNDGSHCYDLSNLDTLVWYHNQPYKPIYYWESLLESRAFTAWCYGVSLDEINEINAQEDVLTMLPRYMRLIPQPTRDCYLDHPDILEAYQTIHIVQPDETLHSIAKQYDMPYQIIALTNELDTHHTIWDRQKLIIPNGFTWRGLIIFGGIVSSLSIGLVLLYLRKRRQTSKKKGFPKKNEYLA